MQNYEKNSEVRHYTPAEWQESREQRAASQEAEIQHRLQNLNLSNADLYVIHSALCHYEALGNQVDTTHLYNKVVHATKKGGAQ